MKISEDNLKGIFEIDPDGSGKSILRFGRMKYDGKLGYYVPDCAFYLSDFYTRPTKSQAKKAAKYFGFPQNNVEKIGSRFWSCWGIRYDFIDRYFLTRNMGGAG